MIHKYLKTILSVVALGVALMSAQPAFAMSTHGRLRMARGHGPLLGQDGAFLMACIVAPVVVGAAFGFYLKQQVKANIAKAEAEEELTQEEVG